MGTRRRYAAIAVLICACAGSVPPLPQPLRLPAAQLRDGDVLLLSAASWRGALVEEVDGSTTPYVHIGLMGVVEGQAHLYHATPADRRVVAEPLDSFLEGHRVKAVRVLRVDDERAAANALAYAREQVRRGTAFDHDFDLDSPVALYCTELIWRAYLAAGLDLLAGRTEALRRAPLLGAVLWPADFTQMPALRLVTGFATSMGEQG